ncbi:hypothetical protein GWI33_011856 [Rhynchophorus ferrugineus]|uniref:Uncharacterized protein n=1 Tax=Rhynchophorus ferrugineus TaxID=354439 RepID=A0A834I6D8_RHYFE|nr:hypothetical protein GWI33_011856 [Rhynchophorus ferrugineus]
MKTHPDGPGPSFLTSGGAHRKPHDRGNHATERKARLSRTPAPTEPPLPPPIKAERRPRRRPVDTRPPIQKEPSSASPQRPRQRQWHRTQPTATSSWTKSATAKKGKLESRHETVRSAVKANAPARCTTGHLYRKNLARASAIFGSSKGTHENLEWPRVTFDPRR